jgi:hypothetical protein
MKDLANDPLSYFKDIGACRGEDPVWADLTLIIMLRVQNRAFMGEVGLGSNRSLVASCTKNGYWPVPLSGPE